MAKDGASRNDFSGSAHTVVQAGAVSGGVHVHLPEVVRHVPRQLPPTVRGFVGRADVLDALDAVLGPGCERDAWPRIALITGTAGVGKTALAVHWAHAVGEAFPDGVLYADLHGYGPDHRVEPEVVLASFLRALGVRADQVPDDVAERAARYRTLLTERRLLVVLDNARDEAQVRPLVPSSSSVAVLVTSRQSLTGLVVDFDAEVLHLDVLPPGEGTALLRGALGDRAEREPGAVAELVQRSAGLPLALRVLVGLLRSRDALGLAELADALADEHARLDVLDVGGDVRTEVRAVFSWSYQHLSPAAARVFRLLGLFPGHRADRFAAAALSETRPPEAAKALAELQRAHLLTEPVAARFELHDLLRAYAAELVRDNDSGDDRAAAVTRLFDYYLHTADQADRFITPARLRIALDGGPRPGPTFADRDQALAWLVAERETVAALFAVFDRALDTRRWQLAYTMRGYYFLAKEWGDSIHAHEFALAATQRLGDRRAEATTRNNLGVALLECGRADVAEAHYTAASRLYEEVGDLRGMSNALANRAWIAYYRGDYEGALRDDLVALEHYRSSGAELNAAITLRGVALAESRLGRTAEAVAHLHEALAEFDRLGSDLDAAMAWNCLGEVWSHAAEPTRARDAHLRAVELSRGCGSRYEEARGITGVARADADPASRCALLEQALALFTALDAPEAERLREELG